jgi:hypothetical protein
MYGVLGLEQIESCRKVPLLANLLDDDILHRLLRVLSFYESILQRSGKLALVADNLTYN